MRSIHLLDVWGGANASHKCTGYIGPWRQHFDDELRLRQNHRKNQGLGLLFVSILWPRSSQTRISYMTTKAIL